MRGRISFGKRLLAMVLSIVLVAGLFPATHVFAANTADTRVVDPSTFAQWKDFFGPDVLTTDDAGAVWTDKSVYTAATAAERDTGEAESFAEAAGVTSFVDAQGNPASLAMKDPDNNFLVALSALASNKEIVGYSTIPTDTMLVLDMSGSMAPSTLVGYNRDNDAVNTKNTDYVSAMVQATNDAIGRLQELNRNNRVGVVLYSGNSQVAASGTGSAQVLLPLDRYTPVQVGQTDTFLEMTTTTQTVNIRPVNSNRYQNRTIVSNVTASVKSGLRTEAGSPVSDGGKTAIGGTYIQNGLYQAWQQFADAEPVITDGIQAGTKRMPIMVLMSDGAPTTATTNYTNIGTSNSGSGQTATNELAFLTQLTASWIRDNMHAHYETAPRFYTLGLDTGSDYDTSVLDPANSNTAVKGLWNSFRALGSSNLTLTVPQTNDGYQYKQVTIAPNSAITNMEYVEEYFPAEDAAAMIASFGQIVDEIIIQSRYYPTLVSGTHDLDGYVTFHDELGEYMEVKDVKGLVIGNVLFSGSVLAKAMRDGQFGNAGTYTSYGWELLNSVGERLGISGADAIPLLQEAWGTQLYYNSDSDYGNYIGWYADSNGQYLGHYAESDKQEDYPENTAYINRSYGFLGQATGNIKDSDMMHIVVMVKTNVLNGHCSVEYKIPAALIPMVTYRINLEGDDLATARNITMTREDAKPITLLFEVGLQERLNPLTVAELMASATHKHETGDGRYYFYSNRWGSEDHSAPGIDYSNPDSHLATSTHYHPSLENERHFFIEDADVYVASGSGYIPYTGGKPSGTGYYHARKVFVGTTSGGAALVENHFEPITAETLALAQSRGSGWYIPKGTIYRQRDHFMKTKSSNDTETLQYADYPSVSVPTAASADYDAYSYLGNNGRLVVAPAQGITLTKTVDAVNPAADNTFDFTITLTGTGIAASYPYTWVKADGTETTGTFPVTGGVITVRDVENGDTVHITEIASNISFQVQELSNDDYKVSSATNTTGTITNYVMEQVAFINTLKEDGNLSVHKEVTHGYGENYTIPESLRFTMEVTLAGPNTAQATFPISGYSVANTVTTDAAGKFTLQLTHDESVIISGLPEGTTYTVAETNLPDGFALQTPAGELTGTITGSGTAVAALTNHYQADPVTGAEISLSGTKTLTGRSWQAGDTFSFLLDRYDGVWQNIATDTITDGTQSFDFTAILAGQTFDSVGTYYFRVTEEQGAIGGISYDLSHKFFEVRVTDADMDGKLEIASVVGHEGVTVNETANPKHFAVTTGFTNTYTPGGTVTVELPLQKYLQNDTGVTLLRDNFSFELYLEGQVDPVHTVTADALTGEAKIQLTYTAADVNNSYNYILKEKVSANPLPGIHYDPVEYHINVAISDTGTGTSLAAQTQIRKDSPTGPLFTGDLVFTNTYNLDPADVSVNGTKELVGRDLYNGEFTFEIYKTDFTFNTTGVTPFATTDNNGQDFAFRWQEAKAGTYHYVVKEQAGSKSGVAYDVTAYHITVEVAPSATEEKLVATVTDIHTDAHAAVTDIKFTNTYTPAPIDLQLTGDKDLTGRDLYHGEFKFRIYRTDAAFAPQGAALETAENTGGDGSFAFAPISVDTIGTYYFLVEEVQEQLGGVSYDQGKVRITVTVDYDPAVDGLVATYGYAKEVGGVVTGANGVQFTNTYTARSTGITFSGTKTIRGRALQDQEFTFILSATDSSYENPVQLQTKTNDASGDYSFYLPYSTVGDYYYTVTENRADPKGGVHYDATVYRIHVVVFDNGQGQLETTAVTRYAQDQIGDHNDLDFRNTYTATPASVELTGTKQLVGRALQEQEFTFWLFEADDNFASGQAPLFIVKNHADGTISFPALELNAPGTYRYVVKEDTSGQAQGLYYDETAYHVTVEVTDNLEGALTAQKTVTVAGSTAPAQIVFNNRFEDAAVSVTKEQAVGLGEKTTEKQSVVKDNTVTYTITVTNIGIGEARNVVVSDKIPAGLSYVKDSASNDGSHSNGVVTWQIPLIPEGRSAQVTFQVTVPGVEQTTTWTNQAEVTFENNPEGAHKKIPSNQVQIETVVEQEPPATEPPTTAPPATEPPTTVPPTTVPPAQTPQTGDSFSVVFCVLLMTVGLVGMVTTVVLKKREEEETAR